MARRRDIQTSEPALMWSVALSVTAIALWSRAEFAEAFYQPDLAIRVMVAALGAAYFALAGGLAFSMGEPLPANPREGYVPLRLRLCWAVLGLALPPGRTPRALGALAASAALAAPIAEVGIFSLVSMALLFLLALMVGEPKETEGGDTGDTLYLGSLAFMGFLALLRTFGGPSEMPRSGVAVLAVLWLLAGQRAREVCAARWAQVLPGVAPPPALDLSRYELTVERKAPVKRVARKEGVEAELVDTGSFRVDAAKMLDKLRGYQLKDPRDFICAWLRCAAASGATKIELRTSGSGLELAFDGRAFSAAELAQPYQALLDADGENAKRDRHFAYGLLGLYRLKPRSVSVTSRGPGGVAAMNAGAGKPPDPASAPEGTVIRVHWPLWGFFWRPALLARWARERYGLGMGLLIVNGVQVPDHPEDPVWHFYRKKGWRAALRYSDQTDLVRLYVLGTFIEEVRSPRDGPQAWLTHDDLELDISQSSVVRGKRLTEGLELIVSGFK